MKKFKAHWQIQHNWQLIFPVLGLLGLGYCAFKLANLFESKLHMGLIAFIAILLFYILLKICLLLFKKLEKKWIVTYRWEMIRIFLVFAITGSSSMIIGRPIIKMLGITVENLHPLIYWILYIFVGLIFYQILLIIFGWLFGQFQFFWEFEKKMLKRFGLGKFMKN